MKERNEPIFKLNSFEKKIEKNVYGKEKFLPEEARRHVEEITFNFINHYASKGYKQESSVLISSGIDESVRFIGSPISVLKPYIIGERIPENGVFMSQDCIRTKNIDNFLDDDFQPAWGSYFPNMGAITSANRIEEGCKETFDFFEEKLNISADNILIRVSSEDRDLLQICRNYYGDSCLEIDSKDISYYRHKLGVPGVWGRNCNIALRNSDNKGFCDVANIIIIENSEKKLGLEMSIGVSTTLKQMHTLDHVQDCVPVIGLEAVDSKFRRKFEDAVVTSVVLFREGLRPLGKNNMNRILKKYIRSISYFRNKCNLSHDELLKILIDFENMKFSDSNMSEVLMEYIRAFEQDLVYKKELSVNDQKVRQSFTS